MSRRVEARLAARTAVAWVAVAAGMVMTGFGLSPVLAEPAGAGVTTSGPAGSTTTTTTVASTVPTSTSTSTSTSAALASSSTSPQATSSPPTSDPAGSGLASSTSEPAGSSSTTTPTDLGATAPTGAPSGTGPSGPPASGAAVEPASSTTATTGVTTTPPTGALSVSAPDLLDLGATTSDGGVISARMGTVTVTDTRGVVDGAWTVRVSATPFSTGRGHAGQWVARSSIAYWSGPATARSGTAALVPGQPGPSLAVPLTTTRTAFSATGVAGDNTAAWNPTVVIRIPEAAVAGRYRGAIIHSVA